MLQRDQDAGQGGVAAGLGHRRVELLVHGYQGLAVARLHGRLAAVEGVDDPVDVGRGRIGRREGRAIGLQEATHVQRVTKLDHVQRRHGRAGPRAAEHQSFERQPAERIAHAGQSGLVALG